MTSAVPTMSRKPPAASRQGTRDPHTVQQTPLAGESFPNTYPLEAAKQGARRGVPQPGADP